MITSETIKKTFSTAKEAEEWSFNYDSQCLFHFVLTDDREKFFFVVVVKGVVHCWERVTSTRTSARCLSKNQSKRNLHFELWNFPLYSSSIQFGSLILWFYHRLWFGLFWHFDYYSRLYKKTKKNERKERRFFAWFGCLVVILVILIVPSTSKTMKIT